MSDDQLLELNSNEVTDEEVVLAARRAYDFLNSCLDGEVADAKVSDRIMAARTLLEHAARTPRLLNEVVTGAEMLSEEDLELIGTALE